MLVDGLRRIVFSFTVVLSVTSSALAANTSQTYRDGEFKFRISYPGKWILLKSVGQNTRFSIRSPSGTPLATCNIVVRKMPESISMTQLQINSEINEKILSPEEAQSIIAGGLKEAHLVESKTSQINNFPGHFGVVERYNQTLDSKIFSREMKFITFKPGLTWSLMCGAAGIRQPSAKDAYHYWESTFRDILGSFLFEAGQ